MLFAADFMAANLANRVRWRHPISGNLRSIPVIARSVSDEAIHSSDAGLRDHGLLRFARNDEQGAASLTLF
jgi:hypothetical protein